MDRGRCACPPAKGAALRAQAGLTPPPTRGPGHTGVHRRLQASPARSWRGAARAQLLGRGPPAPVERTGQRPPARPGPARGGGGRAGRGGGQRAPSPALAAQSGPAARTGRPGGAGRPPAARGAGAGARRRHLAGAGGAAAVPPLPGAAAAAGSSPGGAGGQSRAEQTGGARHGGDGPARPLPGHPGAPAAAAQASRSPPPARERGAAPTAARFSLYAPRRDAAPELGRETLENTLPCCIYPVFALRRCKGDAAISRAMHGRIAACAHSRRGCFN